MTREKAIEAAVKLFNDTVRPIIGGAFGHVGPTEYWTMERKNEKVAALATLDAALQALGMSKRFDLITKKTSWSGKTGYVIFDMRQEYARHESIARDKKRQKEDRAWKRWGNSPA